MKLRYLKSNYTIYAKIFLYMTTSISITIFVLSAIFYVNFSNISLSIINSYIKDSLSQISYSATFMTVSANTMIKQLYSDTNILYLLNNLKPDYPQLSVALDRLNAYKASSPFIHSIYIFNSRTDTFYSSLDNGVESKSVFSDRSVLNVIENPGKYNIQNPIPRSIPADNSYEKQANVYTFALYDFPSSPDNTASAIILNVSTEWIRDIITSMESNNESDIFVIDSQGKVISSANSSTMLTDISGRQYIRKILSLPLSSGFFISDVKSVQSLVTYVSSPSTGWRFISITPYESIVSKINRMRYFTILTGILILLCGIFSSVVISRKLYKPIDSMVVKLKKLESENRNRFSVVKQEFLRKLLHEGLIDSRKNVQTNFSELNIQVSPKSQIVLAFFKIDHFFEFCNRFNSSDRNLYKFSFINIASELFSEIFTVEGIDAGDDHMVLILEIGDDDPAAFKAIIDQTIKKLQGIIREHLQLSFTSVITPRGNMSADLKLLYEQALIYVQHRIFLGRCSIIHVDEIAASINQNYIYPIEKEKELIDALMTGKADNAKSLYLEIINQTLNCTYNTFNLTILRLLTAINIAVDSLEKDLNLNTPYKFDGFISVLNSLETLQEVEAQFFTTFEQINEYINTRIDYRKSAKYTALMNKIVKKINTCYTDKNLSLDSIADSVNMSSIYLGRLFKKITSKSVADYMNEIRLGKAKELLISTENSVNEIADEIGFSSSNYFHATFKKAVGVTPNVYRQCKGKIQDDVSEV